jgi:biopolymer transport protein ExbD/biopolymer transport protein TolR
VSFGQLGRGNGGRPMSDINMTPLIDVMLVLLVIFIITAPLLAPALRLDLPRTDAGDLGDMPRHVALALDRDGKLYDGDQPTTAEALATRLAEAARRDPQLEVQLRADRQVAYGRVAELIALIQKAGLNRIAFVTEPPEAR